MDRFLLMVYMGLLNLVRLDDEERREMIVRKMMIQRPLCVCNLQYINI